MKSLSFLRTKLNKYSIIGSTAYGLFCATFATPEVVAVIGHILYFLSAALFYFAMYVLYSERKTLMPQLWNNKFKIAVMCISGFVIATNAATFIYMLVNKVTYEAAIEVVANAISTFFYYIPFLP